jgi:hypothetical protein
MASKRSLSWAVAFTGVVCASAMANVQITSDRGEDGVEEVLAAGQIVSVELRARCDADAPLLGADIELWCASDHVRIRDVAVNPTLGRALGQQKVALPARRVRLTRVQAPGNLITDFAVAGATDWLVRVQLEIMSDQPFRSGLEYRIRTVASDPTANPGLPASAVAQLADAAPPQTGRIPISNLKPGANPASSWTIEEADVFIEVVPIGGGQPVNVLTANTTYEVHYRTRADQVQYYIAFIADDSEHASVASVTAPSAGYWAGPGILLLDASNGQDALGTTGSFGPVAPALGSSQDYLRRQMIVPNYANMNPETPGPNSGCLLTFTTGEAPSNLVPPPVSPCARIGPLRRVLGGVDDAPLTGPNVAWFLCSRFRPTRAPNIGNA